MLQKEFENFNSYIRIKTETKYLIEKRDMLKEDFRNNFPEKCKELGIDLSKKDIEFVSQGSYKLGTTIKSKIGEVDLDLGVIFPMDIYENEDTRKIKKKAKAALEITNRRVPKIKEPCVTVEYIKEDENWIHVDFPLYAKNNGNLYLARGKEFGVYSWERSDPHGLNDYILDKLKESEDYSDGQLRRLVRYIKKWKQESYSSNSSNYIIPPSIGLTLFAVDLFQKENTDLLAFKKLCENILRKFIVSRDENGEIIGATINNTLPVHPYTDVFSRFEASKYHGITFYKRLEKAVSNLKNAIDCDNDHDAANYVVKVLGSDFEIPEKEVKAYDNKRPQREHSFG